MRHVYLFLLLLGCQLVTAQISLTPGSPVTENFTGFTTGVFTNNVSELGWYLSSGTLANDNGSNATAGMYRYGNAGDRSLGTNASGASWGVRLRNSSTETIHCIQVDYRGEQWRLAESGTPINPLQYIECSYQTGTTVTSLGGGTVVPTLQFSEVQNNAICGTGGSAINGNTNSTLVSGLITGLNILPNEEIMIQWAFPGFACSNHGFSIDDVSILAYTPSMAPVTSNATSFSTCSFVADWTAVPGASAYLLDISTDPSFTSYTASFHDLNIGTAITYVANGLNPSTTYYYRTRAVLPCDTSVYSNISQATTLAFLSTPTAVVANPIHCIDFTAQWNALSGASAYRLDVATDAGFTSILPGYNNLSVTGTSQIVSGLSIGTVYFYRVRAVADCGTTGNSNVISVVTLSAPVAPVANAATNRTACSFSANWASVSNATTYELDVSTTNTFASFVAGYNSLNVGNTLTASVSGLSPSITYYYRIRAVNACGTSIHSNVISTSTTAVLPAPSVSAATAVGCNNFTANWAAVSGASNYLLEVATDNAFSSILPAYNPLSVIGTSQVVSGLTNGTTYYYRVKTQSTCGISAVSGTITVTTTDIPTTPIAIAANAIGCTGFTARWNASTGAASYTLDVSTDPAFGSFVPGYNGINVGNVTSRVVTGLANGTTYYYRVQAQNTCGFSFSYSNVINLTTTTLPPPPIVNPVATWGCTNFTATWSAASGASAYLLDVSTDPAFGSFITGYNALNVGNVLTRNITGLTAGTTYYFRVRTSGTCGISVYSNIESITTLSAPTKPVILPANPIANCQFTAHWNTVIGASSYTLYWSANPTFSPQTIIAAGTNNSWLINGLTANTTYYYRVVATNACGSSIYSDAETVITLPVPIAPINLVSSAISCNTFDINWDAVSNATGYRLDVSTVNTFASFVPGYNNVDVGNVTYATISGLNPGTTYYIRVRAYIGTCATGANSVPLSVTTLSMPGTITAIAASNFDCQSFQANWNTLTGVDGYLLDVSTVSTFASFVPGYQNLDVGNVNNYVVTGLNLNTVYYYRLRGYNTCGTTLYSNIITASRTLNIPNNVGALAATAINCYDFTARWNAIVTGTLPTHYLLTVATTNTFTPASILPAYDNLNVGNVTNYLVSGLSPGTTYYYHLKAENACGISAAFSGTITVTTQNFLSTPTATNATNITQCAFSANWTSVPGPPINYRLDVALDPGFTSLLPSYSDINVGNVLTYPITGLSTATTYYYRVRAENNCGITASSNVIAVTTLPSLNAPFATPATNVSCNIFTANWQAVSGATSYRVDVSTDPAFGSFVVNNVTVNAPTVLYNVTGLSFGTTYYYRIRAVNACETTTHSNVISVTTATLPPIAVSAPASNIMNCSFIANWLLSPTATSYRLDVSLSPTFATFVINNLNVGNVLAYSVTGLVPNTTYYYRVRAINACGTSANSDVVSLTTLPNPTAPIADPATQILCIGFTANWSAVLNANGYFLDVSTSPTFASFVAGYNNRNVGNALSFDVTGLTANTTYYYRIRAYIGVSCTPSPSSNTITVITDPIQPAPTAIAATNIECTQFTANWTLATGATAYLLDVSTVSTFATLVPGFNGINVGNVDHYDVSGLNINTLYYYRIRAINPACTSAYSGSISVRTLNIPNTPTIAAATNILCSSFQANWIANVSAGTPPSGYELFVSTNNTFTALVPGYDPYVTGLTTNQVVSGLTPNTTYYYRIRAINDCGNSGYTGITTVTTQNATLATPGALAPTTITSCSFLARWSAAAGATGYELDISTDPSFATLLPGYNPLSLGLVTSYSVTGLTPGVTYYYRVRAWNDCLLTPSNATQSAVLPAIAIPNANAASLITPCSFRANWSAVAGAISYLLDVATDNTFSTFVPGYQDFNLTTTNTTLTGLSSATTYYYRVRVVTSCGTSNYSNIITVNTLADMPDPVAIAATPIACVNFTARWNVVTNATAYLLDVSTDPTFSSFVGSLNGLNVGNVTTYNVTGLSINTHYYYRVRAINTCNTTIYSNVIPVTTQDVPTAPTATPATLLTSCSFTANWTAATGYGSFTYYLDVSTDNTFGSFISGFNNLNVGTGLNRSVTGLTPNTTYYYRIKASNVCGLSVYSNIITVVVPDLPNAPILDAATGITCTSFAITWSTVTDVTNYYIDVSSDPAFGSFVGTYNSLNLNTNTNRTVTGLAANGTYYVRVRAKIGAACPFGVYSNVVMVNTLTTPDKVDALPANPIGCNAFTANWNALAGASSYRIDVSPNSTFSSFTLNNVSVATTSYNVTGLTPGATYYYRVRAVNACGSGLIHSDTIQVDLTPLPATPVATVASDIQCTSFTANWNASTDADGYYLDVSTSATFASFLAGYNNRNMGNLTTFNITGLTSGVTYYYRVRAYRAGIGCTTANSNSVSVPLPAKPIAPTATAATSLFPCQFDANWSSVGNATGYYLDVLLPPSYTLFLAGYNNIDVGNVNTFTVTGTSGSTAYRYRVRAYNACGISANSNVITATTPASAILPPPNALAASFILSCRFNAEWQAIPGSTHYLLDVSTDPAFGSFIPGYHSLNTGATTTWPIAGLLPNTTYYYRLTGVNACGTSIYSNTITVTTDSPLATPNSLSATDLGCGSFTANWTAVANVQDYRLDVSTVPTFATLVPGYNNLNVGNVNSYAITGLAPNTTYYYRIRAVNPCGATSSSGTINLTTPDVDIVVSLPPSNLTCTQFTANWNAVPSALYYVLDVSTSPTFTPLWIANLNVGNVNSYQVSGISIGNIYYYRLKAVLPCGISPVFSSSESADYTIGIHGLWTGAAHDWDWNNCMNWDNLEVPTYGDVIIPSAPTTTPQNVPTVSLHSLTLDNTLGIRMVGDVTLTSYLKLVHGLITTQTHKVMVTNNDPNTSVVNGSNIAVSHTDIQSYVFGNLERAVVSGNYTWPIGTATLPQYATFDFSHFTGGLTSIVGRFNDFAPSAFITPEFFTENTIFYDQMEQAGYWAFTPNTGVCDYDMEIFPTFPLIGGTAYTFVKKHDPSAAWTIAGSHVVMFSPSNLSSIPSLKRTHFTDFSDYAIVYSTNPLPVELLSFNVQAKERNAYVTWETSQEIDLKGFELEHADVPTQFSTIGWIDKKSGNANVYQYMAENLSAGIHYFRLKKVDLNGHFNYSETKSVEIGTPMVMYPIPAHENLWILFPAEAQFESITDLNGKVVSCPMEWNKTKLQIDIHKLSAGVYFLHYTQQGIKHTLKWIKD